MVTQNRKTSNLPKNITEQFRRVAKPVIEENQLDRLEQKFINAVPSGQQNDAQSRLDDFKQTVLALINEEKKFHNRDRWTELSLSHAYLRSQAHTDIFKQFKTQAENIAHINTHGQELVKHTTQAIHTAAIAQVGQANPPKTNNPMRIVKGKPQTPR